MFAGDIKNAPKKCARFTGGKVEAFNQYAVCAYIVSTDKRTNTKTDKSENRFS